MIQLTVSTTRERPLELLQHSHHLLHARGLVHARSGDFAQALRCYDEALALQPQCLELQLDRANALQALNRRQEALDALDRILKDDPDHIGALNNRGNLLQDLGRHDAALVDYERAIILDPSHPLLHNNRAMALRALERDLEARASYERAIALEPDNPRPYYNLANLLVGQPASHDFRLSPAGSLLEAIPLYRQALQLDPSHPEAGGNLATVLLELGRVEEAIPVLRASLNSLLELRRQAGAEAASKPLPTLWASLLMFLQYLPGSDPAALGQEARHWGEAARVRARALLGHAPRRPAPEATPDRPLRIGYLSGDLTLHPVGLFLRCVLMAHDPARVTPFLYDNGSPSHPLNERLGEGARRKGGEHHRVETLDDLALAQQIAADRIDILVDLSGHTARSRLETFALRPAPLQLSWLGYFANTGLAAIDGLILDPISAPEDSESQLVEPVLRLPHSRFCFQPAPFAPAVTPPPFERNGHTTFGSFNNTSKLNREVLCIWAGILRGLPQSRLILQWRTFCDPAVAEALRQTMAELGVGPEQLELRPSVAAYGDFLQSYADIDLALDPFPFSGGQTSCEALWQGVPVLTLPGFTVVSRQTAGFLRCIGLEDELSASDAADYKARAITLARNPARLAELRQQLRDRMAASPLCDFQGFTADLEAVYHRAWDQLLENSRHGCQPLLDVLRHQPAEDADPSLVAALDQLGRQPDDCLLLSNAGEWLRRSNQLDDARICLERALTLNPQRAATHLNLGLVLHDQADLDGAIQAYRRSIELQANLPSTWVNLGTALVELGQAHGAIEAFQQALRLDPELAAARSNLAKALLQVASDGHSWQSAWQAYEARFINRPDLLTELPGPRWRGEDMEAPELVLVAEQGLGDTLQFIRYAPLLRQRFPRLVLHGHPKLAGLLLDAGLIDAHRSDPAASAGSPWLPLLSLPGILGVSRERPSSPASYLTVDPQRMHAWQQRLGNPGSFRVAINWQGDPRHERLASRGRSLPLEAFAPLASIPGLQLVSMQKGAGQEQRARCSFPQAFCDAQQQVDDAWDFRETAAILKACDLVISSDTCLAHLAAGLGLPTWILLPRHPEWRWEREGDTTAWYPSARLFRQREPGDWNAVISEVRDQLGRRTAGEAGSRPGRPGHPHDANGGDGSDRAGSSPSDRSSEPAPLDLLALLGRRACSIQQVVTLLTPLERPRILELGATRSYRSGVIDEQTPQARIEDWDWGGGCASYVLPALLPHARLTTVDVSAAALAVTRTLTEPFRGRVELTQLASTDFLQSATSGYDLIYMDHGETSAATAALHLRDAHLIVERNLLNPGGLILIDDHGSPARQGGKGALSLPYLLEQGFILLSQPGWYQALLQKRPAGQSPG